VEEINAKGGVNVGAKSVPLQWTSSTPGTWNPGVPVSEALMAMDKLILEKKVNFIIGGPVRSEAALAAMSLSPSTKSSPFSPPAP
jgi:branched-chain amino acid transport system substrate-binding protein